MAEQEYPIAQFASETTAANDDLATPGAESTSLLSQARLEARYLDANLLAANEPHFAETAALSEYPVDAFYRACARHLKFGPTDTSALDPESDLVQDAAIAGTAPESPFSPAPKASKARTGGRKGPSYAL